MAKRPKGLQTTPEVRKFLRAATRDGWTVEASRNHPRIRPPGGGPAITLPGSPGSRDWKAKARSSMRRALEASRTEQEKQKKGAA